MTRVKDNGFPPNGSDRTVGLRFTQHDFDLFARLSGDDNPIHVDREFAATTRFGRTVAHGMLLFAAANAAINRWIGGRLNLHRQQLVFPAPTFADEDVALSLTIQPDQDATRRRVDFVMTTSLGESCRGQAFVGFDELTPGRSVPAVRPTEMTLKGLRVGMQAARTRILSASDVQTFVELIRDPHPGYSDSSPLAPPALLGGAVSDLLGVSLPGPGSNWLKQTYRFHRHVRAGAGIRSSVTISRLRPPKDLVNLQTEVEVDMKPAVSGEALLLVTDVADRSSAPPPAADT